jgi:hypothetical protein
MDWKVMQYVDPLATGESWGILDDGGNFVASGFENEAAALSYISLVKVNIHGEGKKGAGVRSEEVA